MTTGTAAGFATTGIENHPGHADQKSHGRRGGSFDERAAEAATGDAALSTGALKTSPTTAQAAAIERYGGDGSYVVNGDLRSNRGSTEAMSERNRTTVEQLDSVMRESPLSSDVVVYRRVDPFKTFGRDINSQSGDQTGLSWRDHAYTSTSVAERGSGRIRLRILVPKGTPGFSHPSLDSDEIVLGRGLKFTVVRDHGGPEVVRRLDVVVEP